MLIDNTNWDNQESSAFLDASLRTQKLEEKIRRLEEENRALRQEQKDLYLCYDSLANLNIKYTRLLSQPTTSDQQKDDSSVPKLCKECSSCSTKQITIIDHVTDECAFDESNATLQANTTTDPSHLNDPLRAREARSVAILGSRCKCCHDVQTLEPQLAKETKLRDMTFGLIHESSRKIILPHHVRLEILRAGYEVAQRSLFKALQRDAPMIQIQKFASGPSQIAFGLSEMQAAFKNPPEPPLKIQGHSNRDIMQAMLKMIPYRNYISHPCPTDEAIHDAEATAGFTDYLLHQAQALTVWLKDRDSAFEIRDIRDRWRQLVRDDWECLTSFNPGARNSEDYRPWAVHHQQLFRSLGATSALSEFPPTIQRAVADFTKSGRIPGLDHDRQLYSAWSAEKINEATLRLVLARSLTGENDIEQW